MKNGIIIYVYIGLLFISTASLFAQKNNVIIDSLKKELINALAWNDSAFKYASSDTDFKRQIFIDQNVNNTKTANKKIIPALTKDVVKYLTQNFTGAVIIKYKLPEGASADTGKIYKSFKNGQPHGKWEINPHPPWAESYMGYYKNGLRDSLWILAGASANGDRYYFSGKYINGEMNGLWTGYNDAVEGSKDKVTYKNGRKNGPAVRETYCCEEESFGSGAYLQYTQESIFRNDTLIQYTELEYYENKNKKSEGQYYFDKTYYKCDEDANPCLPYDPRGKNGFWKYWDENGKLIKEETYKNGQLVK